MLKSSRALLWSAAAAVLVVTGCKCLGSRAEDRPSHDASQGATGANVETPAALDEPPDWSQFNPTALPEKCAESGPTPEDTPCPNCKFPRSRRDVEGKLEHQAHIGSSCFPLRKYELMFVLATRDGVQYLHRAVKFTNPDGSSGTTNGQENATVSLVEPLSTEEANAVSEIWERWQSSSNYGDDCKPRFKAKPEWDVPGCWSNQARFPYDPTTH